MKRVLIIAGLVVALVALAAVPAFALMPNGGPHDVGGGFCSPWDWAWFKAGNWWYWQFFEWCWSPQSGWTQTWGNWGWE